LLPAKREEDAMNFDTLFANPSGRTARGPFTGAVITLLAVLVFYYLLVRGRSGEWSMLVLLYPGFVLHARRLRDMGKSVWPLLVPAALIVATGWFCLFDPGNSARSAVTWAAAVVSAAVIIWGLVGKSKP
jgi:uncharacterized membrane protein YhaH (DUF805 family)